MRLVVGEDNALLRDGLIRLLEANGCRIVAAVDNAPELEVALREVEADGAVLDVRMPPASPTRACAPPSPSAPPGPGSR